MHPGAVSSMLPNEPGATALDVASALVGRIDMHLDRRPGRRTFLGAQLDELQARAALGGVTVCAHLDVTSPAAFYPVWTRDRLSCPRCASQGVALAGDEDRPCDRCRARVAITPCSVQVGPIVVLYGACSTCRKVIHRDRRNGAR
jgi:hypothetical protein